VARLEESLEALTHHVDLLSDILIHLLTLTNLGAAAANLAAFCHIIIIRHFNHRMRALHAPSLLSIHALCIGFCSIKPLHPSAAAAQDLAASTDFGFSFLPTLGCGYG
jgi:hypothetical protein